MSHVVDAARGEIALGFAFEARVRASLAHTPLSQTEARDLVRKTWLSDTGAGRLPRGAREVLWRVADGLHAEDRAARVEAARGALRERIRGVSDSDRHANEGSLQAYLDLVEGRASARTVSAARVWSAAQRLADGSGCWLTGGLVPNGYGYPATATWVRLWREGSHVLARAVRAKARSAAYGQGDTRGELDAVEACAQIGPASGSVVLDLAVAGVTS